MLSIAVMSGLVSLINFGIHAVMTGLIVIVTRRIAIRTDNLHVFTRLTSLLIITGVVLMIAHVIEIWVWAVYYGWIGLSVYHAGPFEFAFENYTALGYGDAVPQEGNRVIGPITALNGLLLIGWSVAIIFEVMKMADVQIGRDRRSSR
jgi:Ion channel